jgi:hypothetical protein
MADDRQGPAITYGNNQGPYFTQWRFDELTSLAREIDEAAPGGTGWRIWYDAREDFHRLEFDLDGHHYNIQLYKIFTIDRDGQGGYDGEFPRKNYGRRSWDLVQLFRSGRHRTWEDPQHFT